MKRYLYDEIGDSAAILVVNDIGDEWEHQAGGCSCLHPTAKGFLCPIDERLRNIIHDQFWSRCPSKFEVNELMCAFGMKWKSHPYKSGMEAWFPIVSVFDEDEEAVLVWNNSD